MNTQKWTVHEIELTADEAYDNPYLEVDITATFDGPSGAQKVVKGFWDGERTYRVRFTPTQEGEWQYTIENNKDDAGLTQSGTLEAGPPPPDARGFLRRDVAYPTSFIFDDGTRYFMWGTTYYGIISNARASDNWKAAVDNLPHFGITKARMNVHDSGGSDRRNPHPYTQPYAGARGEPDHDRLDLVHWQTLDRVVEHMGAQGVLSDLIVMAKKDPAVGTDEQARRYAEYVVARYAAYPHVIWCVCNEWNYADRERPFWNMIGKLIHDRDPWMYEGDFMRAHSIHQQTRVDFQFFGSDWLSHAIVQYGVRNGQSVTQDEWDDASFVQGTRIPFGDKWGNHSIVFNLGHDIPVVNDEYGYMGEPADKSEPHAPLFTRLKHRQVTWGIAVAGGYGSTGDKNLYRDGRPYVGVNWHADPPDYRDVKHMVDFFTTRGIEYWKMASHNDLVEEGERVYALAEPGKQYVFYAAAGGRFTARLEPGLYEVLLYNPRMGDDASLGTVSGGLVAFEMPDGADWVVQVTPSDAERDVEECAYTFGTARPEVVGE